MSYISPKNIQLSIGWVYDGNCELCKIIFYEIKSSKKSILLYIRSKIFGVTFLNAEKLIND